MPGRTTIGQVTGMHKTGRLHSVSSDAIGLRVRTVRDMWHRTEKPQNTPGTSQDLQYIPRNMHTVFALLCFVVVIHWLIFPYPSGLLHWHCGNLTIAPVPAKQPWWIWINASCEFIMNNCVTTTKQSTTKPCAYFLGYTVCLPRITTPREDKSSERIAKRR